MSYLTADALPEIVTFHFPAIYHGIVVKVTIAWDNGCFAALIDGAFAASIQFNEDLQSWYCAKGDLRDHDLLIDIGARIEAKYLQLN